MLLERTTLDAIGRPVLSAGEVQQAELDQVGQPATALCIAFAHSTSSWSSYIQAQIQFEVCGTFLPEGGEGFQDHKVNGNSA